MQIAEFIQETSKIEKFYNKALEQYEKDIWYQELKNIPVKRYAQVIRQAFNECKFMPKLADIVAINKELPYNTNKATIKEKVACSKCHGDGVIKYFKKVDNGDRSYSYEYFARCVCQNGNDFNYDGTKISDEKHRSKFYIPSLAQLSL